MTLLPWQAEPWRRARERHGQGRLPQALLLAGPRGVGKQSFARQLAALLVCEASAEGPCGRCRPCTQLAAGTQPDALLLSTEGLHCLAGPDPAAQAGAIPLWSPDKDSRKRDIGVDGIRRLIEQLGLSRHGSGARIAVVAPADALNISGANMLLKTIEEPPAGTHLVLVAERWRELPATLRSRCQIWRLPAPPREAALAWLRTRHPGHAEAALAPFAHRPLSAASALEADAAERRTGWTKALEGAGATPRFPGVKREDARAGLECWLETAAAWLRQRLAPQPGGPAVPARYDAASLAALVARVQAGLRALDRNGNPALVMESIIIRSTGLAQKGEQWLDPAAHSPES